MTSFSHRLSAASFLLFAFTASQTLAQSNAQHSSTSGHDAHAGHKVSEEQAPPQKDPSTAHQGMAHGGMDHAGMDHSRMDHSTMNGSGMMHESTSPKPPRADHMVEARGVILALDRTSREVTIRHDGIPVVSWPPARMIFPVGSDNDLTSLSPGGSVQFTLHRASNGTLPLVELCSTDAEDVVPGLCSSAAKPTRMNHADMAHGAGHSAMDDSSIEHSNMDHSGMDHAAKSSPSQSEGHSEPIPAAPHAHDNHN